MQRNPLVSALDVFLGRHMSETVMRQLRATMARARAAVPHPRGGRVGRQELEAMMRQLARAPRRG